MAVGPSEAGQVTPDAAEVYERLLIPGMMRPWAERIVREAEVAPRQRILDVGCGTGVLAGVAAASLQGSGAVVGVDSNAAMLAVARRKFPALNFACATAESLPHRSGSFDRVLSQFALMFFADQRAAIAEMVRVLGPQGRLCVAVWAALEASPAYQLLAALLDRSFGSHAGDTIRVPCNLGRPEQLQALLTVDGLDDVRLAMQPGTARFPSVELWLAAELKGWVLADQVDDDRFRWLVHEAASALAGYVAADGAVAFEAPALVALARRA